MKALVAAVIGFTTSYCFNSTARTTHCSVASTSISQNMYHPLPLINAYDETKDTKVLRFALPEANKSLDMEVASCLLLQYVDKRNKEVVRPYTPISRTDQLGYFEILVKKSTESPLDRHLCSLKMGETINVKGPYVTMPIRTNQYKSIGMIACSTGIAPMYHVARNLLRQPKNATEISLIYANESKEDVLLGNEINELMENHSNFSPYFLLKNAPLSWMGGVGDVSVEIIKAIMPSPNRVGDSIILVSGPASFMKEVSGEKKSMDLRPEQGQLQGYLKALGYDPKMVFKI